MSGEGVVGDLTGARRKRNVEDNFVMPTTKLNEKFEVTVLQTPRIILRELEHIFSNITKHDRVLSILTCQHSDVDLVNYGGTADIEKDNLLKKFVEFAKSFCSDISEHGHWADYIDPCSGLAAIDENPNRAYSEVDGMQLLLQYKVMNAGCCKVLLHPEWGSYVYPASIFTTAPEEIVLKVINVKPNVG